MTTNKRLDSLTQRLKDRGVVDFKMTLDPNFYTSQDPMKVAKLKEDVANFVEAYLEGRTTKVQFIENEPPFNLEDSPLDS